MSQSPRSTSLTFYRVIYIIINSILLQRFKKITAKSRDKENVNDENISMNNESEVMKSQNLNISMLNTLNKDNILCQSSKTNITPNKSPKAQMIANNTYLM